MSLLRLFLVWLVMTAIPFQGFAAASMVYCKGDHQSASSGAADPGRSPVPGVHDHSSHPHAAGHQASETAAQPPDAQLPDLGHKCGVCASCCHSLAIAELPQWPEFLPIPQADLAEPFVLIHTAPSPVPDKPPRA